MDERLDTLRTYKLSEVSSMTGIPQTTLSRWAREGKIEVLKTGRLWRMTAYAIQHLLENGTIDPGDESKLLD